MKEEQVKQRTREEMDPAYTWDLTPMFNSDEDMHNTQKPPRGSFQN